jgi:hypothetical protein
VKSSSPAVEEIPFGAAPIFPADVRGMIVGVCCAVAVMAAMVAALANRQNSFLFNLMGILQFLLMKRESRIEMQNRICYYLCTPAST